MVLWYVSEGASEASCESIMECTQERSVCGRTIDDLISVFDTFGLRTTRGCSVFARTFHDSQHLPQLTFLIHAEKLFLETLRNFNRSLVLIRKAGRASFASALVFRVAKRGPAWASARTWKRSIRHFDKD